MSEIRLVKKNKEKSANIKLKVKETTVRRINDVNEKYVNDFVTAVNAGADKRGAKLDERANNIRSYMNFNSSRLDSDTKKTLEDILDAYDSKYKNGTPRPDQERFDYGFALDEAKKREVEAYEAALREQFGGKTLAKKVVEGNKYGNPSFLTEISSGKTTDMVRPVTKISTTESKFDESEWEKYLSFSQRPDFEKNSKPVSTAKNLTDKELKEKGYTQSEDGNWFTFGLGGVSWYQPNEDMIHEYINASEDERNRMFDDENVERGASAGVLYSDRVATSKYSTYGQMTEDEVALYNYIYNTSGKDAAEEMLAVLKPELDRRFLEGEKVRLEEMGRENPVAASVFSVGTNLQAALLAPGQLAAAAVGKDDAWLDNAAMTTTALRGGAGERASELNVNVPLIDKNLGELLYGSVMSIADMGAASLLGAGIGGGGKAAARITQAIMSSSAASNAVYSAHERGLNGIEVTTRGVLAGAIEWATEKYSIESLFSDGSKGIIIDALKQMGIEASEETASSVLNTVADEIIANITGNTSEIDDLTNRYVTEEGLSYEDARRRAIIETVQEVGADALAGALSGGVMGAGKGVAYKAGLKANRATEPETKAEPNEVIEPDTETLPVGDIGEVSIGVGKAGAYEVQLTETEGEVKTVDVDSLSRNSPEYKILRAAEDSHMTPAVADAVLRGYDGSVSVNDYVAEAEYVSAAAKAGTAYEAILKGSDTLSEDVRRAIWEDGRAYSENMTKARQTFLDEVKAKSEGKVMSGRFVTKDIKGMKLNRTQERAVKTAEALSSLGFNIRMVKSIGGDSRKLGYYDKRTGDIVVSVNARSRNIEGAIKSQILPTMAHEITHSFRATSPELYSQYRETVLGALYGSGELQRLVENEFARLRDSGRFAEATDAEIYDAAYDELVARASEDMLADPAAIEKICRENRTVGEKILEAIDRFISTLKSILSGESEESVHEEARILRGMLEEYEAARELWVKALADSAETRAAQAEEGDAVKGDGTPVAEGDLKFNEAFENYEENKEILNLIKKVNSGEYKDNEKVSFGKVSPKIAAQIKSITGINVEDFAMVIEARQIKHILNRHGKQGTADTSLKSNSNVAKMEFVLDNPDNLIYGGKSAGYTTIKNGKPKQADTVLYSKSIGDSTYYVAQAVPNTKKKTLFIVTAYITKNEEALQVVDTQSPGETSETPTAIASSGNRITQINSNVNTSDEIAYNEALDDELTMREVLTGALEGAALTEADEKVLERYRRRVSEIDGYDERLREVNREIKEISFAKGKRNTARLSELKNEKARLEQDLKRADRKLLELSSTEALKNLFDREAKRLRREKSEAARAATKEARRMSEAQLKEAAEGEREAVRSAKLGEKMAAEAEIAEIRRRAAERELKDRTRRERLDVEKRIRSVISYVTSQTDDKNVKQGLRGVVADFAHAILSNNAAYTQSEMTRMRERYEEIAEAGEDVEFIHKGAYDFDIFEELKKLESSLNGRAWRDLTTSELGTVDRVTRNLMHMIRLENKIFRNGKAESRVKIGEACERAIAECVSRRGEKTTPKGKIGEVVQKFGEAVDGLIVTGNLMPVYYFDILGGEFEVLYNDLVDGQNKWARIVEDSARKADEIKEKYDFNKLTKGETVFTTDEGVSFEMTVREAMYFYAAFKRETLRGDTEHYLKGGIASDKIVAKAKGDDVKRYRSGTVRLSGDDAAMILDSLSTEQKAFVDELVAYLSTDIARYGNETSMDLYGIEKFGDEYYIPYRVSGDAILKDPVEAAEPDKGKGGGEAKIKHTGITNAIKHGAGNAMEQADIMEVFTKHCVEMANYAAFAVPIENIGGVLNFRGADGELLRAEMRQKLGDNMTSYFDTFIRDMNGGVKTTASGIEKFLSLQKKASVAASLSTVVQQPTAMLRAMAMIDPKYFVTVKGGETMQGIRASWDEMKQYAPGVTVVKDMGKFDVGSGVSAAEYISGDMTFGKAVDKGAGFLAEWADKLTWIHIWKACKAEAKAKGLRGEELLTSAGKRFTDVINRTQVYDSTLVRSENMRSRNALMKPFTAFKAEPTVTLNVMADAVRSKSPAKIARTASALLASTIVNNALRALVYAGRDDDEEKGYLEKYGVEFSEGLWEDMMLWNYVPFVSDLASITRGFKSKRMETQLFESVYNSFNALWEDDAGWREWATFVGDVGNFAGLPVKNVIRDFVMMPMNIASSSDNSVRGAWYAAIDTLGNSTTGKNLKKIGINITNTDYDGYIEALENGDGEEAEKIFGAIIEHKMFKARRKAEAEGSDFDEDEARKNAESSVRGKITEHLESSYDGYLKALDSGDTKGAAKLYGDITELLVSYERVRSETRGKKFDEKKALASAETSLQSRVTKHFKKRYVAADYDERTAIRQILRSTGLYDNVRSATKAWVKSAEEEDE